MATAREVFNLLRSRGSVASLHDIEVLLNNVGGGPHVGKGALITLTPGTPIAGPTALPLIWTGATVVYDDLGFFDVTSGFKIPVVDPPIQRVRMWTFITWGVMLGSTLAFHGFTSFGIPVAGGAHEQLPETGTVAFPHRLNLISAPLVINTTPFNSTPLNTFAGQASGGPITIASQAMSIEVVQ